MYTSRAELLEPPILVEAEQVGHLNCIEEILYLDFRDAFKYKASDRRLICRLYWSRPEKNGLLGPHAGESDFDKSMELSGLLDVDEQ